MFEVTVLDATIPANEEGKVDFAEDFFGRQTNLTVSDSSKENWEPWHLGPSTPSDPLSVRRTPIHHAISPVLDD